MVPRLVQRDDVDMVPCHCVSDPDCIWCKGEGAVPRHVAERSATVGHVTTNRTMRDDLMATLREAERRATVLRQSPASESAGLTFGDFIDACLNLGIRLSDPLGSIEYGVAQMGNGCISLDEGENGIEIREGR